jgi:inhibitor of KinA sporulation pathway (predicted exonuclease)
VFYCPPVLIIFDLELTAWPGSLARNWSGLGEHAEVIQIGAARLDEGLREVGSLDLIVRPRINPLLSDFIIGLTGLTQERVDRDGIDIEPAIARLAAFAQGVACLLSNGRDGERLKANAALVGLGDPLADMRFGNLSHHFRRAAGSEAHVISADLPRTFGFDMPGRGHDGLADARAIAEALRRTLPEGGVSALIAALQRDP